VRLIRSGPLDPALNLALDEALLRAGTPTLRLYAWDPPGLSLGYFQRTAEFECPPGYRLVRRPTGGGAIAHTGELTISWIGRRRRVDDAYAVVNGMVAAAVARLGVETAPGSGEPSAAPAGLCFDEHTRYDLMVGGRKLFGSAQRRGGDCFLLHGTLVLRPNPLAAGAISLEEAFGRPVPRTEIEEHVIAAAPWDLVAAPPTPQEWQAAERLVEDRYANDSWTHRR
jgi:lipoate-protein ligase A